MVLFRLMTTPSVGLLLPDEVITRIMNFRLRIVGVMSSIFKY
jgi:hypothetical protein